MSLTDHSDEINYLSQWPPDKIVGSWEDTFNASTAISVAGYMKLHQIPHDFHRPVVTRLKWSTDGVNWIDGGVATRDGDTSFLPVISYSNSNYLNILSCVTTGTIYYQLEAIWIDDYDNSNPSIEPFSDQNKPYMFDSRDKYQGILFQDTIETSGASVESISIPHYQDFIPKFWVFFESFSGEMWPALAGGANNPFLYDFTNQAEVDVGVGSQYLDIDYVGPAAVRKIHYRIYKD